MKKQIILSQEDIIKTIADSFKVEKEKVRLETYKDYEGFGPFETAVYKARVTVEVPMDE